MLEHPGVIGKAGQVIEFDCGQAVERWHRDLSGEHGSGRMRSVRVGLRKSLAILPGNIGPSHLASMQVSAFSHGMPGYIIFQEFYRSLRDGSGIIERNQHSASF